MSDEATLHGVSEDGPEQPVGVRSRRRGRVPQSVVPVVDEVGGDVLERYVAEGGQQLRVEHRSVVIAATRLQGAVRQPSFGVLPEGDRRLGRGRGPVLVVDLATSVSEPALGILSGLEGDRRLVSEGVGA